MVLTERDSRDFVINLNSTEERSMLPPAIRTALAQNALLFIGCSSIEDVTFGSIFQGMVY
jgi:hypothetical protein